MKRLWPLNRRVFQWVLTAALAVLSFVSAVALFRDLPERSPASPYVWAATALILALVFSPLRSRLFRWADRLFYGGWYEHHSVVGEMSQALSGVGETDELAGLLVERLPEVLRLEAAALLLPTAQGNLKLTEASGTSLNDPDPPELPSRGALAAELLRVARPLDRADARQMLDPASLTEEEKWWLLAPRLDWWIPLVGRSAVGSSIFAKLNGVLLLSRRTIEGDFDPEDRRMLGTLAWSAAVAAENVELIAALRRRADEVNRLYSQLVDSRESERKRLARELHDRVIQDLIDLHYTADSPTPGSSSSVELRVESLRNRLRSVIDSIRQVCAELRPSALDDLSLVLAIGGHVEDVREKYGLRVALKLPSGEEDALEALPEESRLCLFRVLQEALHNVHRHAEAGRVDVELLAEGDVVTLEVRDDGRGFTCPANLGLWIRQGRFGLAGAQERMSLIGGRLQIESRPGHGTRLRATIPLEQTVQESGGPKSQRPDALE